MYSEDSVQSSTDEALNEQIEVQAKLRVGGMSIQSTDEITRRIEALDAEWDIERWLGCQASALALSGLLLGLVRHKKYFLLPTLVLPLLLNHHLNGWCPPLAVFRRLGIRTRKEIDHEKYALKALRGDFANIPPFNATGEQNAAAQAWQAARP